MRLPRHPLIQVLRQGRIAIDSKGLKLVDPLDLGGRELKGAQGDLLCGLLL